MAGLRNQIFWICMCVAVGLHSANASRDKSSWWDYAIPVAVGGAVVLGGPVAIAGLGFTSTGIVAGSIGAKMMSAAAIANGGGVVSGGVVAVLQSVGAAGMATSTQAAIGAGVGAAAAGVRKLTKDDKDDC